MTVESNEMHRSRPRNASTQGTPPPPQMADGVVHCPSCYRRERWEDGTQIVESAGGSRKPTVPPELAAWRTVFAAHRGQTPPVVCACAGCEQPMIGEGTPISWTIHTPQGDLHIDGGFTGPDGPMSEADAAFWAEETLRIVQPLQLGKRLFEAILLTAILTPVLSLWVFAFICFFNWVITFGKGP